MDILEVENKFRCIQNNHNKQVCITNPLKHKHKTHMQEVLCHNTGNVYKL